MENGKDKNAILKSMNPIISKKNRIPKEVSEKIANSVIEDLNKKAYGREGDNEEDKVNEAITIDSQTNFSESAPSDTVSIETDRELSAEVQQDIMPLMSSENLSENEHIDLSTNSSVENTNERESELKKAKRNSKKEVKGKRGKKSSSLKEEEDTKSTITLNKRVVNKIKLVTALMELNSQADFVKDAVDFYIQHCKRTGKLVLPTDI